MTTLRMPNIKEMFVARMNQPNILMDVHDHFRHMILDCEWFVDPIIACVNPAKHQTFMTFSTVDQLHAHVKDCLGFKDKLSLIERKRKERIEKKIEVS